jgi:hypothetical protein
VRIYVGDRGTGKTTRMIDWFVADYENRVIIVHNASALNWIIKEIKKRHPQMAQTDWRRWQRNIVMPGATSLRGLHSTPPQVFIDNLDLIISAMVGIHTSGISATSTEPIEVIDANPVD